MRQQESYTPFIAVALGLTVVTLGLFQIYILREPARIAADEERDLSEAIDAGETLFADNCALCHGQQGEGAVGPALNDKPLLAGSSDERLFSLISSGVPNTQMPAWNQSFGGPFTDEQIGQLVAFVRNWEATAVDHQAPLEPPDPARGQVIFDTRCAACHGQDGEGTNIAPRLRDSEKLGQFDDQWYIDTITQGRPAQGMPTWGTVLSPQDIRDVVALLRSWE